jgi:pilus assembly protein CpaB
MPNTRGILFIVLALAFGGIAAYLATRDRGTASAPQSPQLSPVVVARIEVPVAATLEATQLGVTDWPAAHLPPGVIGNPATIAGRVTRRPLAIGEPVLESALLPVGSAGGLVALISPNLRAVSVKVDNVVGVAGFVQPGARVDVFATLRRVDEPDALPYSKLILQNARVLAVDQQLEQTNKAEAALVSVATLEVSPEHAEQLIYAAHEGRLQLALRSPGDTAQVETPSVGVADVLPDRSRKAASKPSAGRATRGQPRASVQVLLGSKIENRSY